MSYFSTLNVCAPTRGAARPASATAMNANKAYFFMTKPLGRDYITSKVSANLPEPGLLRGGPFDNQKTERSGEERCATAPVRMDRTELSGSDVNSVVGRVEPHVARSSGGLERLRDRVVIWRILMDDGQRPIGIRRERITRSCVVSGAVHTRADWRGGDDLTSLVIRDGQEAAPATAEESMVSRVDCHRHGLLARSR